MITKDQLYFPSNARGNNKPFKDYKVHLNQVLKAEFPDITVAVHQYHTPSYQALLSIYYHEGSWLKHDKIREAMTTLWPLLEPDRNGNLGIKLQYPNEHTNGRVFITQQLPWQIRHTTPRTPQWCIRQDDVKFRNGTTTAHHEDPLTFLQLAHRTLFGNQL